MLSDPAVLAISPNAQEEKQLACKHLQTHTMGGEADVVLGVARPPTEVVAPARAWASAPGQALGGQHGVGTPSSVTRNAGLLLMFTLANWGPALEFSTGETVPLKLTTPEETD